MTTYINPGNNTGLYGINDIVVNTGYGNANVESFLATGSDSGGNIVGNIVSAGNVTATYYFGNGSQLTGIASSYANANVAAYLASGTNTSNIITTGNISGQYILGNGSQLTGLPATYGNANVATFLASFGSNTVSTTGNVTAGYFAGNGSLLTNINAGNIVGAYGNANVVSLLAGFGSNTVVTTGNITGGNFIGSGAALTSITGANVTGTVPSATTATSATTAGTVTTAAQPNITSVGTLSSVTVTGNVAGGNLTTAGQVSATGNITGSYFLGNGSQLTGLPATYGNANVATFLANFGSNTIVTTGNITGGNLIATSNLVTPGITTTGGTGNITGVNYITASYFVGNGSLLTNINAANVVGAYGNSNVSNFLANYGSNTVVTTGNITGGNLNTAGTVSTSGTVIAVGNITGGNINTAGLVTATGNVLGGNIVIPNAGKIRGDFTSAATAGRTVFQSTSTATTAPTFISGIPGPAHTAAPTSIGAATGLFSSNDVGNASIFGMFSLGSDARIWSTNAGTGNINNMTFRFGSAANLGATLSSVGAFSAVGNITGANINTAGIVSATGNITGGNITGPAAGTAVGIINYKDYVATITYASTISPDAANGSIQQVTLTGNVTMDAFGGTPQAGQSIVIKFIQDATGGRILSSTMKWAGGNKTLSTAANAVDIASIFYDGSTYYASLTTAYA